MSHHACGLEWLFGRLFDLLSGQGNKTKSIKFCQPFPRSFEWYFCQFSQGPNLSTIWKASQFTTHPDTAEDDFLGAHMTRGVAHGYLQTRAKTGFPLGVGQDHLT